MLITAITPQKRKKTRVNIFLDGKFAFSLDLEILVKEKLQVGAELTQTQVDRLIRVNELAYWFNRALVLISRRPHSKYEITDYLQKKEAGESTIKQVLEKLTAHKFIDDEVFTRWFIEQRQTIRPKGKRMIELELRQKGITKELVNAVLRQNAPHELELVKQIGLKKLVTLGRYPSKIQKHKLTGFLLRRGFDFQTVSRGIRQIFPAESGFDETGETE